MSILSLFGQASNYDPYSTYNSQPTTLSGEQAAVVGMGVMIVVLITLAIAYVVTALCLSRIFKKAGVEGWKAWVPVYNTWVMLELGDQKGYWAVLAIIPVVNIVATVFMFIAMYHIGLKLGKDGAFVLLAIFLPLVWLIWLAVDKSTWQGSPVPHTAGAPTPVAKPAAPTDNNQSPPPTI